MTKILSWNVNSLRIRLAELERIAREENPDVVCLQEVKAKEEDFPFAAVKAAGFEHVALYGMAGYNGVAILSRPVPKYDFKAFGAAIKAARTGRKESRKKVSDEMFISPRYLANIEIFLNLQKHFLNQERFLRDFRTTTPAPAAAPRHTIHGTAFAVSPV